MVTIKLDKERELRFDFNHLSEAEALASGPINEYLTAQRVSFVAIRALLWALLRHDDPRLTLRSTGDLISSALTSGEESVVSISQKITEVMAQVFEAKKNGTIQ